ncbi:MAG: hypothetical protein OXG82_19820 [Gammaproteobacteria bacterium]|nr:hypothetical protein [Gammaproteobacteria bacterium]
MVDPVDIHRIAGAALLGGAIILFGAGYAILHALSRLSGSSVLAGFSLLCYAALAACVGGLAVLLHLWGLWLVLVALMLTGYFIAPRFIWRLSEQVHEGDSKKE